MTEAKGYFSLIQFCPNRSRMETVNMGVILLCPALGFLDAATAADARRMKALTRDKFDKDAIDAALMAMENRVRVMRDEIKTKEDLVRFVETRANDFLLTMPRAMRVTDPHADLENLLAELVHRPTTPRPQQPDFSKVEAIAMRPSLAARLFKPAIILPVKQKPFEVDFAYRNGAVNLVKTEEFPSQEHAAEKRANEIVVATGLLERHPPPDLGAVKLILIPGVRAETPEQSINLPASLESTLTDFGIRIVHLNEIDAFAEEIEREAHVLGT